MIACAHCGHLIPSSFLACPFCAQPVRAIGGPAAVSMQDPNRYAPPLPAGLQPPAVAGGWRNEASYPAQGDPGRMAPPGMMPRPAPVVPAAMRIDAGAAPVVAPAAPLPREQRNVDYSASSWSNVFADAPTLEVPLREFAPYLKSPWAVALGEPADQAGAGPLGGSTPLPPQPVPAPPAATWSDSVRTAPEYAGRTERSLTDPDWDLEATVSLKLSQLWAEMSKMQSPPEPVPDVPAAPVAPYEPVSYTVAAPNDPGPGMAASYDPAPTAAALYEAAMTGGASTTPRDKATSNPWTRAFGDGQEVDPYPPLASSNPWVDAFPVESPGQPVPSGGVLPPPGSGAVPLPAPATWATGPAWQGEAPAGRGTYFGQPAQPVPTPSDVRASLAALENYANPLSYAETPYAGAPAWQVPPADPYQYRMTPEAQELLEDRPTTMVRGQRPSGPSPIEPGPPAGPGWAGAPGQPQQAAPGAYVPQDLYSPQDPYAAQDLYAAQDQYALQNQVGAAQEPAGTPYSGLRPSPASLVSDADTRFDTAQLSSSWQAAPEPWPTGQQAPTPTATFQGFPPVNADPGVAAAKQPKKKGSKLGSVRVWPWIVIAALLVILGLIFLANAGLLWPWSKNDATGAATVTQTTGPATQQPSSPAPSGEPTSSPTPSPEPIETVVAFPDTAQVCSATVATKSTATSCPFALNVEEAMTPGQTGEFDVKAFSPGAQQDYDLHCTTGDAYWTCTTTTGAEVYVALS